MNNKLPNHIAIIMDGNGRWAKSRGLPREAGHKKGAEAAKTVIQTCLEMQIPYLTLYTFSSENWRRPKQEVNSLMDLLRYYLRAELNSLSKKNVKVKFLGSKENLADDIIEEVKRCEAATCNNNALCLNIALNYGSKEEIVTAFSLMVKDIEAGKIQAESISAALISQYLYTKDIPDPDLLIRTSGEQRLSNFLLWQIAYTELIFTKILWPDFDAQSLKDAINEYQQRERRYGSS